MTDVLASIGLVEFDRYEAETLPRRKQIFEQYTQLLSQYEWAITPHFVDEERETSYHLYLLRLKEVSIEQRNEIIQEIFKQEVSVNVHYKPLPMLSYYKGLGYDVEEYPTAKNIWETEISLPVYYDLSDEDVQKVVDAVVKAVEKVLN